MSAFIAFWVEAGESSLAECQGRTLQEVASFVASKLATLDRVQSTATHFILKTYKEQGIPMAAAPREERMAVTP